MSAAEVSLAVTGEAPPLYMVHSIGSHKAGWARLVPYLEDEAQCRH